MKKLEACEPVQALITLSETQSRVGGKPVEFRAVYPQNGTAVLNPPFFEDRAAVVGDQSAWNQSHI